MMEFVAANWGGLASGLGVIVSLVGLGWAIKEARGARTAAREARDRIANHLQTVDLERAIALIQRIKLLHDTNRWEASMEQYQALRMMLSDISARCPETQAMFRDSLTAARARVRATEDFVGARTSLVIAAEDRSRINRRLNNIQSDLETLASAMGFGDSHRET